MKSKIFIVVLSVLLLFSPLVFLHTIKEKHGNYTTYLVKFRGIIVENVYIEQGGGKSYSKRIWLLVPVINKEYIILVPSKTNPSPGIKIFFLCDL